jgi:hypothetical protein
MLLFNNMYSMSMQLTLVTNDTAMNNIVNSKIEQSNLKSLGHTIDEDK